MLGVGPGRGDVALLRLARPRSKPSREMEAGTVERMPVPGAPRSTDAAPKFEKLASPSVGVVAATQTRFALARLHGACGWRSLSSPMPSSPPLPAATT